jgi:hypothetical protein
MENHNSTTADSAAALKRPARPLAPFGVELDIDLSAGLDEAMRVALRVQMTRHKLLLSGNQNLTETTQVKGAIFAGRMAA